MFDLQASRFDSTSGDPEEIDVEALDVERA
jgi:hypothetical protein